MSVKALAIGRVSTKSQADNNHSLLAQRSSIDKMAVELDCTIVHRWEMAVSSRRGKNLKRADLNEAKAMCARDKSIKYILLDRVNRLGREAKYLAYYMLDLEFTYGVQLVFCDPSQQSLNGTDPKTFLRRVEKLVEAEQDNEERIENTNSRMRERVMLGYYPFYPHQGYKKTEARDGLHVPDQPRFGLLQKALKAIAHFEMTPKEALDWLTANGYTTPKGNRKLDMNHFQDNIATKPYYAGIIKIKRKDWPEKKNALHQAMITEEEHETLVEIFTGRKVRNKTKFNPDFLLNLARHAPCVDANNEHAGKVTGINHVNGKGWSRKEYVCRTCKKRVPQALVHSSLQEILDSFRLTQTGFDELTKALQDSWDKNEAYRADVLHQYEKRKEELGSRKSSLIISMSTNPELKDDILPEVNKVKEDILTLEKRIADLGTIDEDFKEFMLFSLRYCEELRTNWWNLPGKQLLECKQLLFQDEIEIYPDGKVYTPKLSPIYTLINTKSDPKVALNDQMVELAGSAPASVGLSGHSSTGVVRFTVYSARV